MNHLQILQVNLIKIITSDYASTPLGARKMFSFHFMLRLAVNPKYSLGGALYFFVVFAISLLGGTLPQNNFKPSQDL